MKRVLLDHCLPRPFGKQLIDCTVIIAREMGWQELTNGELLQASETAGIDILITSDKNLHYLQNLSARRVAVIELPTNHLRSIARYAPQVNALIASMQAGEYEIVEP